MRFGEHPSSGVIRVDAEYAATPGKGRRESRQRVAANTQETPRRQAGSAPDSRVGGNAQHSQKHDDERQRHRWRDFDDLADQRADQTDPHPPGRRHVATKIAIAVNPESSQPRT